MISSGNYSYLFVCLLQSAMVLKPDIMKWNLKLGVNREAVCKYEKECELVANYGNVKG